jgi:hypothetical protein
LRGLAEAVAALQGTTAEPSDGAERKKEPQRSRAKKEFAEAVTRARGTGDGRIGKKKDFLDAVTRARNACAWQSPKIGHFGHLGNNPEWIDGLSKKGYGRGEVLARFSCQNADLDHVGGVRCGYPHLLSKGKHGPYPQTCKWSAQNRGARRLPLAKRFRQIGESPNGPRS